MSEEVFFFVPGIAAPGGSKKAYLIPGTRRIRVTDDAKGNRAWRSEVAMAAYKAMVGRKPCCKPLRVSFQFRVPRPRGHYGSGKNAGKVRSSAPAFPGVRPDLTKLVRAAEDACTGIVWVDDAQICVQTAVKYYASGMPGLYVTVKEIEISENHEEKD